MRSYSTCQRLSRDQADARTIAADPSSTLAPAPKVTCTPGDSIPNDYRNDDGGVQRLVEVLEACEFITLYNLRRRVSVRLRGRDITDGFAYRYVGFWSLAMLAALGTSRWWVHSDWRVVPVFFAGWHTFDILRWWVDFLVDRRHHVFVSRERNLVFVALNLLEIAFCGAVFFRATGIAPTPQRSFFDAFFEVTQINFPDSRTHFWAQVVKGVIEVVSLVLLLGGLAAILDTIGGKIIEAPSSRTPPGWPWSRPRLLAHTFPSPWRRGEP